MKIVLVLAVIGLALGKPAPQGFGKPTQGASGGLPKRKLWLTIDDNSLEVFNPLNPSPAFESNVAYNKVGGKAVPNYYYGSSEELYYGSHSVGNAKSQFKSQPLITQGNPNFYYDNSGELNYGSPSVAYAKSQFKSQPSKTEDNPNFYYDNSGELKIIPDPAMVSQVYSQFYSGLPIQGPNAPRYYIDSSGELGVASDHFMTRLVQSNQNENLYRDNSGEFLYVYPNGSHPGNSPSGTPAAAGSSAVLKHVAYNKVGGKAVPNYYYGSSEELYYGSPSVGNAKSQFKSQPLSKQGNPNFYYDNSGELNYGSPSVAYAKSQFKSQPSKTEDNPNFYYDNSGDLKIVPDPAMVSQVYSQFYSGLPVQGPNAPRYYIDSSGELGVASDHFMTRLVQSNQDANLYRDNSGELLYVYPKGSHPGNSQSGTPEGSSAVLIH